MKFSLVGTIAAIAAADALNPATTVGTAYLLSSPRPLKRVLIFLGSAIATRMLVGGVLLFGLGHQISRVVDFLGSGAVLRILLIAIGCSLVAGAVYVWTAPGLGAVRKTKKERPTATTARNAVSFGITLTLLECLTAVPYFGGLGSIERARVHVAAEIALLALFNLIYHAPPIVLVLVWRRSGAKSIAAIDRVKTRISRSFADRRWAMVLLALAIGILLWTAAT